jgi:hypothetical protein
LLGLTDRDAALFEADGARKGALAAAKRVFFYRENRARTFDSATDKLLMWVHGVRGRTRGARRRGCGPTVADETGRRGDPRRMRPSPASLRLSVLIADDGKYVPSPLGMPDSGSCKGTARESETTGKTLMLLWRVWRAAHPHSCACW